MRLQAIRIRGYHVLDDFSITFFDENEQTKSESKPTLDLLVGVNGSGKSSLLRALADIFQALYRGENPGFGFRVTYYQQMKGESARKITISNLNEEDEPQLEQPLSLWVDGRAERQRNDIDSEYLPDWVIALTSGSEDGWKLLGSEEESRPVLEFVEPPGAKEWYLSEQVGEPVVEYGASVEESLQSQYLFMSTDLLRLVVLCGFLQDMSKQDKEHQPQFLAQALRECKLRGLQGFSLKFRMNVLDPREQTFIENLRQKAYRSIQRGSDHLLIFSLEHSASSDTETATRPARPEEIFGIEGTCLNFFQRLAFLQKPGGNTPASLREVNLFFAGDRSLQNEEEDEEESRSPLLLFDWLSDGEQSFLARLCLFAMFEASVSETGEEVRNSEALILLDEPEVHFNDYWKRQLVFMLTEALEGTPHHVFMTTHSSITLSDVSGANIWILRRDEEYTRRAYQPAIRTLGADPSDILVAVFHAENAVGAQSVKRIREVIVDARAQSTENPKESIRRLTELFDELGPGYWRYLVRRELDALEAQNR